MNQLLQSPQIRTIEGQEVTIPNSVLVSTSTTRKVPEPYVLQRELSDFYVQYTLIARLKR